MPEHAPVSDDLNPQLKVLAEGAARRLGRLSVGLGRFGLHFTAGMIGIKPQLRPKTAPAATAAAGPAPLGRFVAGATGVALAVVEASAGRDSEADEDQSKPAVAIGRDQHAVWPDVPYVPLGDEPAAF